MIVETLCEGALLLSELAGHSGHFAKKTQPFEGTEHLLDNPSHSSEGV